MHGLRFLHLRTGLGCTDSLSPGRHGSLLYIFLIVDGLLVLIVDGLSPLRLLGSMRRAGFTLDLSLAEGLCMAIDRAKFLVGAVKQDCLRAGDEGGAGEAGENCGSHLGFVLVFLLVIS